MLKGPVARNDRCVLEFGDSYFEVDPRVAGRLVSAKSGTAELLTGPSIHIDNYGSTFWTSPQSDWSWPPIEEIDKGPYTLAADETSCTMTSARVTDSAHARMNDVTIVKRFSADLAKEALIVQYTIKNDAAAAKQFAPWEITRVGPDGLTFFATDAEPTPATGGTLPPLTAGAGCIWYKDNAQVAHEAKLFSDGKGWIAHVTPQNLLVVKAFMDVAAGQAAPSEAEIEVYVANPEGMPGARYVEVENQGPYTQIPAGGQSTWTVHWYMRMLPASLTATAGNEELVALVQQILQ